MAQYPGPDIEYSTIITIQDCVKKIGSCAKKIGGIRVIVFQAIGAKGKNVQIL